MSNMRVQSLLDSFDVKKGASIASATSISPGAGVLFDVTGTTTTTYIKKPVHGKRSRLLILRTLASLTLTNAGGAPPTGFAPMQLVGAANISMTAADLVILVYDGVKWQQIAPTLVG